MITFVFWWFVLSVPTALIIGRLISLRSYNDDQSTKS
jgi:hypothetical protein